MPKRVTVAALAALVTTLTVPLLPRTAVAQSAVVYPYCGEYGNSIEYCYYNSFAQCRMANRLCARNAMYYLRDPSAYAAAPYANGSVYAAAPFANGSVYAAAPSSWSSAVTYTYAPVTEDPPQRPRR